MLHSGAPLEISEDLLTTFNITTVARGSNSETRHSSDDGSRYRVPHERGIFRWPFSEATSTPGGFISSLNIMQQNED